MPVLVAIRMRTNYGHYSVRRTAALGAKRPKANAKSGRKQPFGSRTCSRKKQA